MKAERLEDLGRIRELLSNIFKQYGCIFDRCTSKHSINEFIQHYKDVENLEELHNSIRYLSEKLSEIHYIAIGENYE